MLPQYNIVLLTFFIFFGLSAAVQLFYYFYFYLAPYLYKNSDKVTIKEPVSIIICARNEADNLREFLPAVLEQDYPVYEVILVNDCSEDNSDDVLGNFLIKYPNLKISSITKDPQIHP